MPNPYTANIFCPERLKILSAVNVYCKYSSALKTRKALPGEYLFLCPPEKLACIAVPKKIQFFFPLFPYCLCSGELPLFPFDQTFTENYFLLIWSFDIQHQHKRASSVCCLSPYSRSRSCAYACFTFLLSEKLGFETQRIDQTPPDKSMQLIFSPDRKLRCGYTEKEPSQ